MSKSNKNSLHTMTFLIIILSIITSATGVFYTTGGKSFDFVNQYGNIVKIYGDE